MNKPILLILLTMLCLPVVAQNDKQAREVLDKASAAFKSAGGIEARFDLTVFGKNGTKKASEPGEIKLKGDKFVLNTGSTATWFDGKTQWSYLKASDEVNISNPTPEELQTINPYSLIQMYRQGYDYRYGGNKTIRGTQGSEIILTPTGKSKEIARITLFVSKSYQPVTVKVEQKDGSWSEIRVTSYKTGEKYPENLFKFNKRNYPDAEIVDLR